MAAIRRPFAGRRGRRDSVALLYANVNVAKEKTEQFVRQSEYDAHMFVEAHLNSQEVACLRAKLARQGMYMAGVAAKSTGKSEEGPQEE